MRPFSTLQFGASLFLIAAASTAIAGTPSRGSVYLSDLDGPLYRVSFAYDGAGGLQASAPVLVANVGRGGSARVLPDGSVVVVGAGNAALYQPMANDVLHASTQSNANTAVLDPDGSRLWCGWKDTALSEVPLAPFGNGTPHAESGDDGVTTMIAFTPADGVFDTTGGEDVSGNFGHIDLNTFVTTRVATAVFATGVIYDAWSDTLITAGIGRAHQMTAADPATVLSERDDSAAGENYLVLEPTGDGHLVGTRSGGAGYLVLLDYSATRRIGDPTSLLVSVAIPGVGNLSGALGFDGDLIFRDGTEPPAS
jgi:hypothetical protein